MQECDSCGYVTDTFPCKWNRRDASGTEPVVKRTNSNLCHLCNESRIASIVMNYDYSQDNEDTMRLARSMGWIANFLFDQIIKSRPS